MLVVTGNFGAVRWDQLHGPSPTPYGQQGRLYGEEGVNGAPGQVVGAWGSGMMLGGTADQVKTALDRVEGRGDVETPPIDPGEAYGEVYGNLGAADLADWLPEPVRAQGGLAADRVGLHVDARGDEDVLLVADVTGPDGARVEDLGKALAGSLAVGRAEAEREGDDVLRELLDVSRVKPSHGSLQTEIAIPLDLLRRVMCGESPRAPH